MKARGKLLVASLALIAAVACAPGAAAEVPPASPVPVAPAARTYPTSTPWPRFGPPPVTADSITATAEAVVIASVGPSDEEPTPTAVAVLGAPVAVNEFVVTGSPTPLPTPVPFDDSDTFEPVLSYSYPVPLDWKAVIGDDEIVLAHSSTLARITVRELTVDRAVVVSAAGIPSARVPVAFSDWNERSLSDSRVTGQNSYRQEYAGTKLGEPYLAFVDWYLWGELLVEVVTEVEATASAFDTNLRNTALLIAASFAPSAGTPLATKVEVENELRVRFNQRPSNIYSDPGNGTAPTLLSCKQVLVDLLSTPVYAGSGEWQVFAITKQGAQVWQIFEPDLNIIPAAHNTSTC